MWPRAKYRFAARVSARLIAASSPQTNDWGNAIRAISETNQSPLGSPLAAESQVSRSSSVRTAAPHPQVDSISP